jgi:hypothetical protein
MIYFLAEYCLDTLNGNFFESVKSLLDSNYAHVNYIPIVSIYIAFIGVNTLDISIVLSQILFLYKLYSQINIKFENLVQATLSPENSTFINDYNYISYFFTDNEIYNSIHTFISYIPIVPIIISISLHVAYISPLNKFKSLMNRVVYALVVYISRSLFSNPFIRPIFEFFLTNAIVIYASGFYSTFHFLAPCLVLSFSGVYFFLKTYTKSTYFSGLFFDEFKFNIKFNRLPTPEETYSYVVLTVLIMLSFIIQQIIGILISFLFSKKSKKIRSEKKCISK